MMGTNQFNLPALWARAGAMFMACPAPTSPDLERLLLDTARQASNNSRLFIMAASWLAMYGQKVCATRLARLIREELEGEFRPIMGLLLDTARQESGTSCFDAAIAACSPAPEPKPLFEIEQRNPTLRRFAERHASTTSRKWNLWAPDFKPKYDAIRPEAWVNTENPEFGMAPAAYQYA